MKERIKSILFVFALALVFVGAAKVTEAAAADADNYDVQYATETVAVKAVSGSAYYQIIKSDDKESVKANAWIPAANRPDNASWPYVIDISALSNTKDITYIAVAGAADADTAAFVVPVEAKIKSVKVTLNYKTETVTGNLYDIIAKLDVKGIAKDKSDDLLWEIGDAKALAKYASLGWKRGANGAWQGAERFTDVEWKMMKNSNTTLYVRVEQYDKEGAQLEDIRISKEAKVKIPKTAKAPSVKVDYKKGTVAIKNGMEFRVPGGKWITVAPKAKKGDPNAVAEFFNVAVTTTAKSALSMAELKQALGTSYQDGKSLTLEIRTSATDKKFMSYSYTVTFTTPVAKIASLTTKAADIRVVTGTTVSFDLTKLAKELGEGYEYALAGDDASLADLKYVVLEEKKLDYVTTKDFSYKKMVEGRATNTRIKYDAVNKLYIRKAGEYKDAEKLAFAGEAYVLDLIPKQQ